MTGREGAAVRLGPRETPAARPAAPAEVITLRRDRPPRSAFPELDPVRGRFSPTYLAHAERRAAAVNIGADRVLVNAQAIDDEQYLQLLASASGIPFEPLDGLPRAACPLDDGRMLDAVAAGVLPLSANGTTIHLIAPRGFAARRLLQLVDEHPHLRLRLRITSARRLHQYVMRHCGAALGERAANALRTTAPLLSAAPTHGSATAGRWWTITAALAAATCVTAPTGALTVASVVASLLFLGLVSLRLLGVLIRPAPNRSRTLIAENNLPVYTVIAAVYREAASIAGLVASIRQISWPPEKLDVKLVIEADDRETREAIARLDLPPWFEIIVAPAAGPRTKPKALDAALPFARGTFAVIYDAEDCPEPDQLRVALDAFLRNGPELACVQAALTIDNTSDSWLTRMFTAEYAAQFDVLLPALARLRLPLPLGGSSNHFRIQSLRAIGAWDPYNVTEDADLGMRLARFGHRSTVIASTTYEEAPADWRPWLHQRTRWFKGWSQTWLVHMRRPGALLRDLGPVGFTIFQLLVGANVLAALIYPVFLALVAARLIAGEPVFDMSYGGLHTLALFGGLSASALGGLIGLARRKLMRSGWVVVLTPLHWMLLSAAAWRSVWQLLRDPYRWEKTEHGLARSSRLADTRTESADSRSESKNTSAGRPRPLRASA